MPSSEQYFFRYAFPCTEVLLQKGKITKERFDSLKKAAESGKIPAKEILEDTYKTAFENLKKIANEMKRDYWDIEVIRKYFDEGGHNDFINSGGGEFGHAPESLKDMCRIKEGTAEEIIGDIVRVKCGSRERMCRNIYKLRLRKGDNVVIHYGYIVGRA